MIAVTHGNTYVNGADFGITFFNVNAFNAGVAGGNLSCYLRHDALAAMHVNAQHRMELIFYFGGPARRGDFVGSAPAYFV